MAVGAKDVKALRDRTGAAIYLGRAAKADPARVLVSS